MPALYALGQHAGLEHVAAQLQPGEHLFAYLDDLYVMCDRRRAATAFRAVAESVAARAGVQTHFGKLPAWCLGGGEPPEDLAALGEPVWRANLPADNNGLMVLGVPIGRPDYVVACGAERLTEALALFFRSLSCLGL